MMTSRWIPTGRVAHALLVLLALTLPLVLASAQPAAAAPPPPPTVPVPTAAPSATPTLPSPPGVANLTLSPTHGVTNTVISVVGDGFQPSTQVRLYWDSSSSSDLTTAAPDSSGHFFTNVTIPADGTAGGHQIVATNGTQTAYAPLTVDQSATSTNSPDDGWCIDIFGAHFCIPTPSSIMYGLANNATNFWGNVFTLATAGFNPALTSSPDITQQSDFSGLESMQQQLSTAAGGLLVFFLTIGALAGYLTAIGRGHFHPLLAPIGRTIFVTGFIAGYDTFMSTVFGIVGALANGINSVSVGASETGFDALGHAFGAITDLLSVEAVIKAGIIVVGVIISLLAVIIRYLALGYLDLLYTIGPLCLVTYVSPQFSFIARWWWRTTLGLALYPAAYALVLKIIANVLTISNNGFNVFDQGNNIVGDLAALGLVLMIYRVPAMVGSLVGAGASVFGSAASAATDVGIATGISLATRGVGNKIFADGKPATGPRP
jgi:hypothetical protein